MSDVRRMSSLTVRCSAKREDQKRGATVAIPLGSSMGARGAYKLQEGRGQVRDETPYHKCAYQQSRRELRENGEDDASQLEKTLRGHIQRKFLSDNKPRGGAVHVTVTVHMK